MKTILKKKLERYASEERRLRNQSFFKMGKGDYGEHDIFLGVSVPNVRKVAKANKDLSFSQLEQEIKSKFHEVRACVLFILRKKLSESQKKNDSKKEKQVIQFYLKYIDYVNNWDLVDSSAPYILGTALARNSLSVKILESLLTSDNLWKRRIALLATFPLIKQGDFALSLRFIKELLNDKEDLIHKATGWALREIGKRNTQVCEDFLYAEYEKIHRTTLRYAIEYMHEKKRKYFLQLQKKRGKSIGF